ncbi:MAG: DUF971 domain-containing protein [Steroidobacteraceae bacterium]|nr:DUF971 domain-containing protein [Nevskiaceae bacterium]MCP5338710.1 DUF971 domain-containing protein [Nevskiaceae bacterium]MCP5473090.1 DUF971 domain-containing protein [Nevskiaceae bacterium]
MHTTATPIPTLIQIKLRRQSRLLEVCFDDGSRAELPFEFLRVHSPSAEVKGHGPGQETLVVGKQNVGISRIEPVGQYAIRLVFDDGHDSGLYSWKYLYELGRDRDRLWARYLERLRGTAEPR